MLLTVDIVNKIMNSHYFVSLKYTSGYTGANASAPRSGFLVVEYMFHVWMNKMAKVYVEIFC